ncbi:UvrD-helicase domain-containing protein [Geoalkalibacter halelectricus]|uniref:UvrD-helicase domain-containing protein n=1 Tax=Geoalkalibacter halelectricus TaxID=2847045 RepID=UPI00266FEC7F|nr:UvrD-helicase domain-containing protein [Geoalkalibacter halelectricus]MDO3380433.1 UvrD-helicase domain-containing protein [Geoalkalibacter halelectricus]
MISAEQQAVVEHRGNARVLAAAGSGKTHTMIHYAKARPDQRILYLAFNRSVKEEAIRRFFEAGCGNVQVETAHSLAYREMDVRRRYRLHDGGSLKVYDIVLLCGLKANPQDPTFHLVMARHIQGALAAFCNSSLSKFDELDYLSGIVDKKARGFVSTHYDTILGHARSLLGQMYQSKIPVTHDAYLKFYQLTKPALPHSCILLDEGQDSNPVMLDVFLSQKGTRVIVGDSHQAIYGFRNAVDSLEKVDFPQFTLSHSYRFGQTIADYAMKILTGKALLGRYKDPLHIIGAGRHAESTDAPRTHAVIARTNLMLLRQAIAAMLRENVSRMYFEGDLNSYTYMSEGASLFDVLYLRMGQLAKIKNPFIRGFGNFLSLQQYIQEADDGELAMVVEIVEEYGPDLFTYIRMLREKQVPRDAAQRIFATTHKAKGQGYDKVEVCSDFLTPDKLEKVLKKASEVKGGMEALDRDALAEEVNMVYVAVTRAKKELFLHFPMD